MSQSTSTRTVQSRAMRLWVLAVLAVAVVAVILGWNAHGGTPDPTEAGTHMSRTSAVVDSAVLVFREGLETILVLAAITASFLGGNRTYRKPVAIGSGVAVLASVATWFLAVWTIGAFLQGLRVSFGSAVVLEGVVLGLLFTAAVGVMTFGLHQRLPYKRLLIITGGMLLVVLWVMVGEEVNEMQLAGWIGTTDISWMHGPGWAGTWFSIFPNVETWAAQIVSVLLVVGSYVGAQYLRVWRPRRRHEREARIAERPPERPAGLGLSPAPELRAG